MKIKKLLLVAGLCVVTPLALAQASILDIGDIAALQANGDGSYDAVCKDGTRETVTDLDIKLNNVCPNLTETASLGVLSLQMREDGLFNVVCTDLTLKTGSREEILAGEVCEAPVPTIVLENGSYTVIEGNRDYYDQDVEATYENGVLTNLYISAGSFYVNMECVDNQCEGTSSSGSKRYAQALENNLYKYWKDSSSGNWAIFQKQ